MVGVSSPRVAIPRVPPQPRGAEAIQARAGRPCDLGGVEARTTRDGGLSTATQRLHQGQESAISTSPKTTGSARFTSDGPRSTCYEEDINGRVVIPEKPALHTAAVLRASDGEERKKRQAARNHLLPDFLGRDTGPRAQRNAESRAVHVDTARQVHVDWREVPTKEKIMARLRMSLSLFSSSSSSSLFALN